MKKARGVNNIGMKKRLLIIFSLTWILLVIVLGLMSIFFSSNAAQMYVTQDNIGALALAKKEFDTFMNEINLLSINIIQDNSVRYLQSAKFDPDDFSKASPTYMSTSIKLLDAYMLKTLGQRSYVSLFSADGRVYSNINKKFTRFTVNPASIEDLFLSNSEPDRRYFSKLYYTCPPGEAQQKLAFERLYYPDGLSSDLAGIHIYLDTDTIELRLRNALVRDGIILSDESGAVILSNNDYVSGDNIFTALGIDKSMLTGASGNIKSSSGGERYTTSYYRDARWNVIFYYTNPIDILYTGSDYIVFISIAVALLCVAIVIFLSWFLTNRFTAPLEKISYLMSRAAGGDLSVRANTHYHDEIGELGINFDTMIGQMRANIDNVQLIEKEKRLTELKVLELQINPHFLYNTLSSIIWLAYENKNDDVIKITKSLSSFFKIVLSDGREFIPVKDEIDHMCTYIEIQQYKYANVFELQMNLSPDIFKCMVCKLILQPIVENAIYHGVMASKAEHGMIIVNGFIREGSLIFEVIDNGSKMTEEYANDLNERLASVSAFSDGGFAIFNVNNRIKLNYGNDYGVHFERRNGLTVVTITTKAIPEDNNEL